MRLPRTRSLNEPAQNGGRLERAIPTARSLRSLVKRHRTLCALLACLYFSMMATVALCAVEKGEWTLSQSVMPDRLQFSLEGSDADGGHFNSSSDWKIGEFKGLDWSTATKHNVSFVITRDAGSFECEGFVEKAEGAGLFTFAPNAQYTRDMAALGFPGIPIHRQFAFALHDVSLDFVRGIKAEGITGVDPDKLIAFRIHGVSPQFVRDLRAAGVNVNDADKLVAFR